MNLEEKTKVFRTKFSNPCDLPECKQYHIKNVTDILGVKIFDENLRDYISKKRLNGSKTLFWFCAKHALFWQNLSENSDFFDEYIHFAPISELCHILP